MLQQEIAQYVTTLVQLQKDMVCFYHGDDLHDYFFECFFSRGFKMNNRSWPWLLCLVKSEHSDIKILILIWTDRSWLLLLRKVTRKKILCFQTEHSRDHIRNNAVVDIVVHHWHYRKKGEGRSIMAVFKLDNVEDLYEIREVLGR